MIPQAAGSTPARRGCQSGAVDERLRPDSLVVALGRPDGAGAPLNVPVTPASTYRMGGELNYGRDGNPSWAALEAAVGGLEGGVAVAYSSGMAAAAAVLETLPPGATVVASQVAYYGVRVLMGERAEGGRLRVRFVDAQDAGAVGAACEGAALLWLETPMNPLIEIADIAALSAIGHERGAAVLVDSTFATPLRQRPLELGAASCCTARPSSSAATPTCCSASSSRATPAAARRCCTAVRRTARPRGRSSRSSRCAGCGRWRCGSTAPSGRPASWPAASPRIPRWRASVTRVCPRTRATSSRRAR
jgi:hypothetical protein